MSTKTLDNIKNYYGDVLASKNDLQTNACCTDDSMSASQKEILKQIHPEILDKFYGCGTPIPPVLDGKTVLDLGCGTGRDVYLLSKLVGEQGSVIGIDMTDNQLDIAKKHQEYHRDAFGYETSNVTFLKGYIEDLSAIESNTVDCVVSNCVINLSPDKERVFKEIFRVLKPGGEMYISDVFSDRRVPEPLRQDPVLHGECLTGALYIEDFRRILNSFGYFDLRIIDSRRLTINNPEIESKVVPIQFYSLTFRVFKLELEDKCENFGQSLTYLGTIAEHEQSFYLDNQHTFKTGVTEPVCGNTADMIEHTRFKDHFKIYGDKSTHFGLFENCDTQVELTDKKVTTGCC